MIRRQLQHTRRTLICQIRVHPHGPLIHTSGSFAYEIFCSLFPYELHLILILITIFCRCQQTVQLSPVPKPTQLKQTTSPKTAKTAKKCFNGNYKTTMYFVLCIVCCVVYCLLCITVLCYANNQMQICSTKFIYFFIKT